MSKNNIHFYNLKVSNIKKLTNDTVSLTFEVIDSLKPIFKFKNGQYINIKHKINNEKIIRSYSIHSSPLETELSIAVKKIPGGKFSSYANESIKVGDNLLVSPPNGNFTSITNSNNSNKYLAFAAGSGITPIMSILKTILLTEKNSVFYLYYYNKSIESTIFIDELLKLKEKFKNKFILELFYTRSNPPHSKRINIDKLNQINQLIDLHTVSSFFLCGPQSMIFLIIDFLKNKTIEKSKIKYELFHNENLDLKDLSTSKNVSDVEIIIDDETYILNSLESNEIILDRALKDEIDLPYSCMGGVCCSCKAKLIEGEVKMKSNFSLTDEEVTEGYILACQSIPVSKKIKIDFDEL
ncbi:MAG: hypothetical protein CBE48_000925 [Flavobacteriales bacterium TMED288]|nr:hypothetical protein [Flavobacteriales bacterium]RPG53735.1 MAG: hypothetical protein CBE48_000925 [Flavobacteriales bacterium TMED288]|tara:strand:- start:1007 stop:2065 length:1059 start_codon:yes stop_codon:yes gene_type:complete